MRAAGCTLAVGATHAGSTSTVGLGSETGRGRVSSKVVVRKRSDQETEELLCLDCDQVLESQPRER